MTSSRRKPAARSVGDDLRRMGACDEARRWALRRPRHEIWRRARVDWLYWWIGRVTTTPRRRPMRRRLIRVLLTLGERVLAPSFRRRSYVAAILALCARVGRGGAVRPADVEILRRKIQRGIDEPDAHAFICNLLDLIHSPTGQIDDAAFDAAGCIEAAHAINRHCDAAALLRRAFPRMPTAPRREPPNC